MSDCHKSIIDRLNNLKSVNLDIFYKTGKNEIQSFNNKLINQFSLCYPSGYFSDRMMSPNSQIWQFAAFPWVETQSITYFGVSNCLEKTRWGDKTGLRTFLFWWFIGPINNRLTKQKYILEMEIMISCSPDHQTLWFYCHVHFPYDVFVQ